jgi:hypothetical protein
MHQKWLNRQMPVTNREGGDIIENQQLCKRLDDQFMRQLVWLKFSFGGKENAQ